MLEQLTDHAQRALVLASDEAVRRGDPEITPEDLLLGLRRVDDGSAATVLGRVGITDPKVRDALPAPRVGDRPSAPASSSARLGAGARTVVSVAAREARAAWCERIGSDHLLLAVLSTESPSTRALLMAMGASPGVVRRQLVAAAPDRIRLVEPRPGRVRRRGLAVVGIVVVAVCALGAVQPNVVVATYSWEHAGGGGSGAVFAECPSLVPPLGPRSIDYLPTPTPADFGLTADPGDLDAMNGAVDQARSQVAAACDATRGPALVWGAAALLGAATMVTWLVVRRRRRRAATRAPRPPAIINGR